MGFQRLSAFGGSSAKPRPYLARPLGLIRPNLNDVTLCCIDCAQPHLALRAMRLSLDQCDFAAALLLTDAALADAPVTGPVIAVRRIAPLADARAYSAFMLKGLAAHIETDFALVVQWDGHVIDGARWESGFRGFDYIGAPWPRARPGEQVGNGGFSLRSRRLLAVLAGDAFPAGHPEDVRIGATWRPALERLGMRFPPPETARRFAVEMEIDPAPSFGFHGLYNFWRCVPVDGLAVLLDMLPASQARGWQMQDLLLRYATLRRWAEAALVRARIEREIGSAGLLAALSAFLGTAQAAAILAAVGARGR